VHEDDDVAVENPVHSAKEETQVNAFKL
jgi:hypothetical protein